MTDVNQIHNEFLQAERLRSEPAFQAGVIAVRKEALEALASIDPTDVEAIRNAQATVRAIDALATSIGNSILRWQALTPAQRAQVSA